MKYYHVYIMASHTRRLYTGITSDLPGRIWKHKNNYYPKSFTARYKIKKLIYFEVFDDPEVAIAREKQIKRWCRSKKVALIEKHNPGWVDLDPGSD
jgi:putative endonuclease